MFGTAHQNLSQHASANSSSFYRTKQASSMHNNLNTVRNPATTSRPHVTAATQPGPCTYHSTVLELQSQGRAPLDRFLAERPGEQSALFNRADTGQTSLARACNCQAAAQAGGHQHAYGYPMELAEEDVYGGERGQ